MKRILIVLVCCLIPCLSLAHNALSARYFLEATNQGSLLTINLSQTEVNHVMMLRFDKDYLEKLSLKEWKELVVNYIKEGFVLKIDGKKIELGKGGIRLGDHQTDLKFVLNPISEHTKNIFVHITSFQENRDHQTIFVYKIGSKKNKVILSKRNQYKSKISLKETKQSPLLWLGLLLWFTSTIYGVYWFFIR